MKFTWNFTVEKTPPWFIAQSQINVDTITYADKSMVLQ